MNQSVVMYVFVGTQVLYRLVRPRRKDTALPKIWQTKRFVDLVRVKVSESVAVAVAEPVRSVPWKLWMAHFHADQAERIFEQLSPTEGDSRVWAVGQLLSEAAPGDRDRPIRLGQFEAEAHTIACAQALHSVVDLFGPIVYQGLGLSTLGSRLSPRQQYPSKILQLLENSGRYTGVADALRALIELPAYRYVRAYVNTTKHRSLVPASYAVSFEADPPDRVLGLRISKFEYEGQKFERLWAAELTNEYRVSIGKMVVLLGIELNRTLVSDQGPR